MQGQDLAARPPWRGSRHGTVVAQIWPGRHQRQPTHQPKTHRPGAGTHVLRLPGGGGAGATESLNIVFPNLTGSEHKLVVLNNNAQTIPATVLDVNHSNRVVGILDANDEVVTFGAITNPSWTWTPEQSLYLGSNGNIATTSTIDGAAFSLKIGYAISSTIAFIKIGTPVVL